MYINSPFSNLGGNLWLQGELIAIHFSYLANTRNILTEFWQGTNCKHLYCDWRSQMHIPYHQLGLVPRQNWVQLESTPLKELHKIVDNRCLQLLAQRFCKICLKNRPPDRMCGNQRKIARKFRTIKLVICTIYPLVMVSPTITIGDALTLIPNWWSKRTITLA